MWKKNLIKVVLKHNFKFLNIRETDFIYSSPIWEELNPKTLTLHWLKFQSWLEPFYQNSQWMNMRMNIEKTNI